MTDTTSLNSQTGPEGFFVVVEGSDGTGKTTLVEALASRFTFPIEGNKGKVLKMRQPGSSTYAENVRDIARKARIHPSTQTLIYMSAINDSFSRHALPYLYSNGIVISDRYYGSTFSYQGLLGDQSPLFQTVLRNLEAYIPADLTIYLTMPVDRANTRLGVREQDGDEDRYSASTLHDKKRHKAYYDLIHGVIGADTSSLTAEEVAIAKMEISQYHSFNAAKAERLGRRAPKILVVDADKTKEALLTSVSLEILRAMN